MFMWQLSTAAIYFPCSFMQADNERRLLELCDIGTADISQFSHLLEQGVDPNIYDKVLFCMLSYYVCFTYA